MFKLFILFFILFAQLGFCQNEAPLIERKGNLIQNEYFILGRPVLERQVVKRMIPYEPAHKKMKASRRWAFASSIIASFGIGSFIPTFFDPSPEVTVPLLITGVGLMAVAIPIKRLANKKADEAIERYNSRQLMGEIKPNPSLNFTIHYSQLGFILKF